jgi:DNA polymerase-3 subunit alpha
MGHRSIGICDMNTMAATLQLQKEARSAGIGYIFGYSLVMQIGEEEIGAKIYVHTQKGFRNLLRLQKAINVDREDGMVDYVEVLNRAGGNVIVFDKWSGEWLARNRRSKILGDFVDRFGGWVFFQVDMNEYMADRIDSRLLDSQKAFFDKFCSNGKWELGIEPVLIEDCYYIDYDEWKNKTVLNKIDTGVTHELSHEQFYRDVDQLYDQFCSFFSDKYGDDMFDLMVDNTVLIAGESDAEYDFSENYMPEYIMTEDEKDKYGDTHNMFIQLCYEGLKRVTPPGREEEYRKRLEYEIEILEQTDSIDYMLVSWDMVNWARKNGIQTGVGRGSAAGALTLYVLGITLIDPLRFNLIFERFLLPERAGLEPREVTVIGNDMKEKEYIEVQLEGKKLRVPLDAEFMVNRDGNEMKVLATDLQPGDDVIFDRRDLLFTLKEI